MVFSNMQPLPELWLCAQLFGYREKKEPQASHLASPKQASGVRVYWPEERGESIPEREGAILEG